MSELPKCKFCEIVSKESLSIIIYEDDKVIVIKNKYPKFDKHYLVIPKLHLTCLRDNDNMQKKEIISYIFRNITFFALRCNMPEFVVTVNNGKSVGQTEFHLHVHLTNGHFIKQ